MDSSAPEPLSSVPFYGLQSKKRNLNIQRTLETCSKRLKEEKIPSAYHSRILGPSVRWKIFYRQNEALDFASQKTEDLSVFAFECCQPDKQCGQRQFLTATYNVFWHYYMQLDESQRHHYEVIPEGHSCKLYFDLEFHKPANPSANGEMMVDTLIKYTCRWLKELYGVQCNRDHVLELSASTETKFSRHLVFQLEGSMFKDNVTAGDFVHAIFGLLEDHVNGETDHAQKTKCLEEAGSLQNEAQGKEESENNSTCVLLSPPHTVSNGSCASKQWIDCEDTAETIGNVKVDKKVKSSASHGTKSASTKSAGTKSASTKSASSESLSSLQFSKTTDSATDLVCCTSEDSECFALCSSSPTDLAQWNKTESGENSPKGRCHRKNVQCLCEENTSDKVYRKCSQHKESNTCECVREKTLTRRKTVDTVEPKGDGASVNVSVADGKERQVPASDPQFSKEKMSDLSDKVFKQCEAEELRALFVKDKDGKITCFVDLGVYTKNRNFRLYKSCKLGKTTAFTVAENNTYTVKNSTSDTLRDREIFLASLITNTRGNERLLTFGGRATETHLPLRQGGKNRAAVSHGDHIDGYGKSPYPEVDDFICSLVCDHGGAVRRWLYLPSAEILSYDIIGYRFCHNVQRQHRSNNIKLVADLQKGVWYQKCYDPDCQAVNFKSEEFKLPDGILPASYFADDFENPEDSMDEDDEICLLALQHAEQGCTSTAGTN